MNKEDMSKVFVSYKRADKDRVFPIVRRMESELGIKFWVDLEGIESDEQFTNVIIDAIIDCEVFLFMFSKAHENINPQKDWTVREINFADYYEKRIVFIDIDGYKLPNWLVFNFPQRQVTKANDNDAMNRLVNDIRKWLDLPQPDFSSNNQEPTTDTTDIHTIEANHQSETLEAEEPYQAIDLGLPSGTKWASCNVGATKAEEYGGYFAWGEIEEKDCYNWGTYTYCDGSSSTCHDLGRNISGTKYDVAHVKLGGNWQMPTLIQFKELLANCLQERTTLNGVKGFKLTSKLNNNSIFLPAAGYRRKDDLDHVGKDGAFWLSTLDTSVPEYAYSIRFHSGYAYRRYDGRSYGLTVRPVSK